MSNLVKRLRNKPMDLLQQEAADKIERLENPWQPIKTAPRDGRYVLATCGETTARACGYDDYHKAWIPTYYTSAKYPAKYWMPIT